MARGTLLGKHRQGFKGDKYRSLQYRHVRFAKAVAGMLMANGCVDYELAGKIYGAKDRDQVKRAKKLMRIDEVKHMIDVEVKKLMEEKGITQGSVVDLEVEILNSCKKTEKDKEGKDTAVFFDRNSAIKIKDAWAKRTELDNEQKSVTTTETIDMVEMLEGAEPKQIAASKKVIEKE